MLQQLFRVFVLFVSASLYANFITFGERTSEKTCLYLCYYWWLVYFSWELNITISISPVSEDWLAATKTNPGPTFLKIKKLESETPFELNFIESVSVSLLLVFFTGYRKIMIRHKYIGCLKWCNLNRYSMNCSYVKHFAQNHLKRMFPEVAQNLDWRQNKQKGFLPLGSLDYRKLHQLLKTSDRRCQSHAPRKVNSQSAFDGYLWSFNRSMTHGSWDTK